jgi:hypothetical protein
MTNLLMKSLVIAKEAPQKIRNYSIFLEEMSINGQQL